MRFYSFARFFVASTRQQFRPTPLLVLRLTELSQIAWRTGRSAARRLEQRYLQVIKDVAPQVLRVGDRVAYEPGSGDILILLASRSRSGRTALPSDARIILERIAAVLKTHVEFEVERGWIILERGCSVAELPRYMIQALERGRQERERFAFFSTIGHELRTPLTAIRGYLETLLDDELPAALRRRFLEIAHTESLRAGRLIDGMFDLSLLDLGHNLRDDSCSFSVALQDARLATSSSLSTRNIDVCISEIAEVEIALGRERLAQIFINLLDNAGKHGKASGVVRITTRLEENRRFVCLIEDDGPGISINDRERVFGLGERGASKANGTGIGLALVRLLLERAGGAIALESSTLGGCAFRLELPLTQSAAHKPEYAA